MKKIAFLLSMILSVMIFGSGSDFEPLQDPYHVLEDPNERPFAGVQGTLVAVTFDDDIDDTGLERLLDPIRRPYQRIFAYLYNLLRGI